MNHYLKDELYQSIQSSPALFDFIQEAALDGLWYWDLENPENEWLSPKFWRLLGFDPNTKRHLASEWQSLIFAEDLDAAKKNLEKHVADASYPYDQVVRYKHKNGSTVWVRCRGLAIRDNSGRAIRMLGAHNDITDLKRAEAALREADKVKSQFLANMSHELKTPLNGILGMTHLARGESDLDKVRDKLEKIESSGQHLLNMVNDLLLFNKIEAGLLTLNPTEFDLQELLLSIQLMFKDQAREKRLDYEVQCDLEPSSMRIGDVGLIKQVLVQLVSNAIKFTQEGSVAVKLRYLPNKEKHLVQFEVIDSGPGFSESQKQQLFKPFMQADFSHSRKYDGVGLGLVISQRIVEKLGGQGIELDSQPGQGSRFRFALPLDKVASDSRSLNSNTSLASLVQPCELKLLVVDDSFINRELTAEVLRQQGFQVELAEDNDQALAKIEQQDFDFVFTDFFLQNLKSFVSVSAWRRIKPSIVVIGMLTSGQEVFKNNSLPEQINDVIDTPLTSGSISSLIEKWFSKQ